MNYQKKIDTVSVTHLNHRGLAKQRGLSLIELMISLTLGLVLLLGLMTIYLTTQRTFRDQSGITELQDKQRNAIALLNGIIQSAGYFPPPTKALTISDPVAIRNAVFTASSNSTYTVGASIFGSESTNDSIQIRFQAASGENIPNCQGDINASGSAVVYDNAFSINANKQLVCAVGINGAAPGTPVVLVDGISNMNVVYGIDTDGKGSATRYVAASGVTAWTNVRSVKIELTFDNPIAETGNGQPTTVKTTQVIQLIGNT